MGDNRQAYEDETLDVIEWSGAADVRTSMRVLIIEDEDVMADALATGLRREGFAVDIALDGTIGVAKARETHYDVVLLDRDLPGIHGDEVCSVLTAERPSTKILMLTAAGHILDRVTGLNLGADDYLTKPFAFVELVARTHALARRSVDAVHPRIEFGPLVIDRPTRQVTRDGRSIDLGIKEFEVLWALAIVPGHVISAEHLLERVWDENVDPFTNAIRVTLVRLRRKLGEPPLIETVRGVGYRLNASCS
jgi:DNA-binding response OmpR family regulator